MVKTVTPCNFVLTGNNNINKIGTNLRIEINKGIVVRTHDMHSDGPTVALVAGDTHQKIVGWKIEWFAVTVAVTTPLIDVDGRTRSFQCHL